MVTISRTRLASLMERETRRFAEERPKSRALFERARASLLGGVPMNWMVRWSGPFPLFVREARGAHFTDVDGHRYLDLCLGDTGAMTGHSPEAVAGAVAAQVRRGVTFMLPTEDSVWVGEELQRRFGLPFWQIAMTATDANRFAIRLARGLTGRKLVLVFNGCYHGTVDETFVSLRNGVTVPKTSSFGPPVDPALTTRAVEFNDLDALERALEPGDVACVLAEPAMTNVGIILPEPGYHQALRGITRRTGTLLVIDETHTICAGPGGYTAAHALEPDILTIGKPIAGGVPAAAYGVSRDLAARAAAGIRVEDSDVSGIGGTLSGNALALAAMRATLERVLTPRFYETTIPLAERFRPALARRADREPRRVPVRPYPAEERLRGGGRHGSRAGSLPPPVRPQPRDPHDPIPQHGPHRPRHHARRHRSPLARLRGGGEGAPRVDRRRPDGPRLNACERPAG